jgi:hypothetical protein
MTWTASSSDSPCSAQSDYQVQNAATCATAARTRLR